MTAVAINGLKILLFVIILFRLSLSKSAKAGKKAVRRYGMGQTRGNREVQSDSMDISFTQAGALAVLADGIGKVNTGKVCAGIVVDTIVDAYKGFRELHNPEYLFKTSFCEANVRIQRTIGERRGGASAAAVYLSGEKLYYGLAGDVRIAMVRNGELILLSEGQTISVLAENAYKKGRLSKKETLWSRGEERLWNYVGIDGFHEIEVCDNPVRLRGGDQILMVTKGIYEELSWAEMESVLIRPDLNSQEKVDLLIDMTEKKDGADKENGSVLVMETEAGDEKD